MTDSNYPYTSGEVSKEVRRVERIKQKLKLEKVAWWEWDGYKHKFTVSPLWEKLTGYEASEIFPQNLSPYIPVETLIDDFISQWLEYVKPDEREKAKRTLCKFLLTNNDSNYLEYAYHLRTKNGEYLYILLTLQSVWHEGRLVHLFCQTRDLSKLLHPENSAKAIVKNEVGLNDQSLRITKLGTQISSLAKAIQLLLPALVAVWVGVNNFGEAVRVEIVRTISLYRRPVRFVESDSVEKFAFLQFPWTAEVEANIKNELERPAPYADLIYFGVYSPELFPSQYLILLQADQPTSSKKAEQPPGEPQLRPEVPQSTFGTEPDTVRTERHVAGETFRLDDGTTIRVSVPFRVEFDGKEQIFFVAGQFDSRKYASDPLYENALKTAAADIQKIIKEARDSQ